MKQPTIWTDRKVEDIIGTLLQVGVILSASVVMLGGAIYLGHHLHMLASYHVFRGEPQELTHIGGILREALAFRALGLIQLGLVLLIATPVARVAFSIFGFAAEKDRLYTGITAFVLIVLLYSLTGTS